MTQHLTIAVAQLGAATGDVDQNLRAIEKWSARARQEGADIVVFPELFVTGYCAGTTFDQMAEPFDGPTFNRVSHLAKTLGMAICYGYAERVGEQIYNSAQLIGDQGQSLANHRKTHLFGAYEKSHFSLGGRSTSVARYKGLWLSILICYEIESPELARANARSSVDIILVPTATTADNNPERMAQLLVRARAAENHVFVAYANQSLGKEPLKFNGGSLISGPYGEVLAGDEGFVEESLLLAHIQPDDTESSAKVNPYLADLREDLDYS